MASIKLPHQELSERTAEEKHEPSLHRSRAYPFKAHHYGAGSWKRGRFQNESEQVYQKTHDGATFPGLRKFASVPGYLESLGLFHKLSGRPSKKASNFFDVARKRHTKLHQGIVGAKKRAHGRYGKGGASGASSCS
jgi:hypothetical protein